MSKGEESLFYRDMFGDVRSVSYWVNKKPLSASSHKDTVYSAKHKDPNDPSKTIPTIRKSILSAFASMKIVENRNKWSLDDFEKVYDKEIRQKLWLHRMRNTNDPVYHAIEARAQAFKKIINEYIYKDAGNNKEEDEIYKKKLNELLNKLIIAADKLVYKVHFVDETFNPITIERGKGNEVLVRTDDNFLALMFAKDNKEKLHIEKIDVNSREKLKSTDGMVVYLNEMIYLFNKKKIIHYGCLRSFSINNAGGKYVKLFNPRFPSNPKAQPKKFSTGTSTRDVSVGSVTGVIKVHLDLTGTIKSYEKFGLIPKELEEQFLKECGYGSVEDDTHY